MEDFPEWFSELLNTLQSPNPSIALVAIETCILIIRLGDYDEVYGNL